MTITLTQRHPCSAHSSVLHPADLIAFDEAMAPHEIAALQWKSSSSRLDQDTRPDSGTYLSMALAGVSLCLSSYSLYYQDPIQVLFMLSTCTAVIFFMFQHWQTIITWSSQISKVSAIYIECCVYRPYHHYTSTPTDANGHKALRKTPANSQASPAQHPTTDLGAFADSAAQSLLHKAAPSRYCLSPSILQLTMKLQ